eukprot:276976_1
MSMVHLFHLFLVSTTLANNGLYVDTTYGTILGYTNQYTNIWLSVPYAAPPIGDFRWAAPQPHEPWEGVLNTMDDPVGCLQTCTLAWWACPRIVDEDCLFINIWAPRGASPTNLKSVMFFIHGGDYLEGYSGGLLYNASFFVNYTDVVLVTANYRLGAQGFLFDLTTGFKGNYGYHDQLFAMEWVRNNIKQFGGNKSDITIFGESAGGVSVATHLLNTSNTLFKAAIIESNPFGLPLRTTRTWGKLPDLLKHYAGCSVLRHPNEQRTCMRELSADDLLLAQNRAEREVAVEWKWLVDLFMPWTPTIGTGVIHEQPIFAMQKGKYLKHVPIIAGVNRDEGTYFVWEAFPDAMDKDEYEGFIVAIFDDVDDSAAVLQYYSTYNVTNTSDYRPLLAIIATDAMFKCATRNISNVIALDESNKALNYMYHFTHVSSFNDAAWPADPECWDKVCHGLELPYIFEPDLAPVNRSYTAEEWQLARTMGMYWSSFAKYKMPGNGNPKRPVEWLPFGETQQEEIILNVQSVNGGVRMERNYDVTVCDFWDTLSYNWIPQV